VAAPFVVLSIMVMRAHNSTIVLFYKLIRLDRLATCDPGTDKKMNTDGNSDISQRASARIAGISLLVIILSSVSSNDLVVSADAAATAHNILTHGLRFRIGLAGEMIMLNSDVVLALALYRLLKPVNETLALLGAFWRIANATVLGVGIIVSLVASDLLGDAHYPTAFKTDQVQALARQLLDVHGTGMLVGLIFFGFGAGIHSYLFWKSRYIPRILAGSYLVVTAAIVACCFAIILFPGLDAIIDPWFIAPDFVVELSVALWLTIKGVNLGLQPVQK
jgi:Domain of unknown function (DUF4386)